MTLKRHFTFVIEGLTHFNEAVRSKTTTRGTKLMFFFLFVFLFVSEPLGVVPEKARLLPRWNKGTSETVHPMTSLRPTLIHIFIYLFIYPPIHSTQTCLCISILLYGSIFMIFFGAFPS